MDVANQGFVQIRAEERVRSGSDIKAAETELNPQLRYDAIWHGGQSHFVLIYQPRFLYTHSWDKRLPAESLVNPATLNTKDPNVDPFSALNNGGAGIELVGRRVRLSLYQFAAYGPVTTTALLVQAPWTGDGPPPDPNPIIPSTIAARFNLLFLQTQGFLPIRVSRLVAVTPGIVYNAFGGADKESRGVIALTQGPGANVAVEVAATKNDRFISLVGGGRVSTRFQDDRDGATIYRSEATETWRHWWSNHISTDVAAGATVGGDDIAGFTVFSLGTLGLNYDTYRLARFEPGAPPYGGAPGHGNRLQVGAVAKVQPWIDLFSGELEQRAVGVLATNYTFDRTTLRASVSTARVFNTPRSIAQYEIYQGETSLRYRITAHFSADAGLRVGYQKFNNAVRFGDLSQGTVFGGVLWTPLPLRW